MRVTPDARSYAQHAAAGKPHEDQIAKAFHDGMLHERAKQKKLAQLASTNAPTLPDQTRLYLRKIFGIDFSRSDSLRA